jgi:hypothetical protein
VVAFLVESVCALAEIKLAHTMVTARIFFNIAIGFMINKWVQSLNLVRSLVYGCTFFFD